MTDWLDDLSEDWPSKPPSLATSQRSRSLGSSTSAPSFTLPTRASHSRTKQPNGSIQNRASPRGSQRRKVALSPRSPSDENKMPVSLGSSLAASRAKQKDRRHLATARRSVSLESTGTNGHLGTVAMTPSPVKANATSDTPDWKKRLLRGEKGYQDQTDLFGPSGIQSIFQNPPQVEVPQARPTGLSFLKTLETIPSSPPWAATDLSDMCAIQEAERDQESDDLDDVHEDATQSDRSTLHNSDRTLSSPPDAHRSQDDIFTDRVSIGGSVRHPSSRAAHSAAFAQSKLRSRFPSGQSMQSSNDSFSAVYIGKHSTEDGGVTYAPIDISKTQLADHLAHMQINKSSLSRSSGNHSHDRSSAESPVKSDDLPEDLPHGTPEMASIGEFVTTKRGATPDLDDSFMRRPLSPSPQRSEEKSTHPSQDGIAVAVDKRLKEDKLLSDRDLSAKLFDLALRKEDIDGVATRAASSTSHFGYGALDEHEFPGDISFASSVAQDDELPSQSPPPDVLPPGFQRPFNFKAESIHSVPEAVRYDTFKNKKRRSSKTSAQSTLSVAKRNSNTRHTARPVIVEAQCNNSNVSDQRPSDSKRPPPSPCKDPTPKRRRTLLEPDLAMLAQQNKEQIEDSPGSPTSTLARRPSQSHQRTLSAIGKRKDARHGSFMLRATPDVLAERQILRPRNPTPSQKRTGQHVSIRVEDPTPQSLSSNPKMETIRKHLEEPLSPNASNDAVQAHKVASEVAAFSQSISHRMKDDSRKKSVTTQDFLDEAMKIMNFIRNNGRPDSGLDNLTESHLEVEETSPVQPDRSTSIEDANQMSASRPSSRNDISGGWRERPGPQRRPSILNHLDRYKETEQDDVLASSVGSHLGLRVKQAVSKIENMQSDPPGLEILKSAKHSVQARGTAGANGSTRSQVTARSRQSSQTSTDGTTARTIGSRKSESVAVLPPEAVAHLIPDEIAGMTFDRERGLWKKRQSEPSRKDSTSDSGSDMDESAMDEVNVSEEDPLRSIPDLTFDEIEEQRRLQQYNIDINTVKEAILRRHREHEHTPSRRSFLGSSQSHSDASEPTTPIPVKSTSSTRLPERDVEIATKTADSTRSAESFEHEIKIHEGRDIVDNMQNVKNVTVSLPTNFTASIRAGSATIERRDFGLEISDLGMDESLEEQASYHQVNAFSGVPRGSTSAAGLLYSKPLSVLEEMSEMSATGAGTPSHPKDLVLQRSQYEANNRNLAVAVESSPMHRTELTFYMSELSEFTVHQTDERQLTTRPRTAGSTQLEDRYAWGNHVLVKALQDSEPEEPYWEDLRTIDLSKKDITSLHMLDQLCPHLESSDLSNNAIQQLSGMPTYLRCLDIRQNNLTSLTWWGHLTNLQYLDISNNKVDNLAGFSCLVHLRELKADYNRIMNLDGLHDLDGLLKLSLRNNGLRGSIDFEGSQLSRLESLDLANNSVSDLKGLQWLGSLRHLSLDHNKLESFAVDAENAVSRIESLDLASNCLHQISLGSFFPALKDVKLDDNRLTGAGLDFGSVQHLNSISLRSQAPKGGQLSLPSALPDTVALNLSLNTLHADALSSNHLFLSLRCLKLSNCGLLELPETFGLFAPNLRLINLNFNAIKDLRPLLNIRRLTHLFCAGNRLTRLRKTMAVLAKLPALQVIDLRANPFTIGFHDPASLSLSSSDSAALLTLPTAGSHLPESLSMLAQPQSSSPLLHLPWHHESCASGGSGNGGNGDSAYLDRLDADTRLRRRVYEMMLASSCRTLRYLDGSAFSRADVLVKDDMWERLVALGVLTRKGSSGNGSS